MSEKKWYKLIFKQVQPIHIGSGSYGVINETRIFIPGWTMWGALTKAYGIAHSWEKADWENENNKKIFESISCFYPAFKKNNVFEIFFPKFKNGEFYLGEYSEDKFRAKFTDTFMSTAIDPLSNTALDESLHELNVILPGVKADFAEENKKEEKQLYWIGIVQIDDSAKIPRGIYIGGDTKYGLGQMVLENEPDSMNDISEWISQDNVIINYFPAVTGSQIGRNGDGKIELVVEVDRPWEQAELKVKLRNGYGFFYTPGTRPTIANIATIEKGILVP